MKNSIYITALALLYGCSCLAQTDSISKEHKNNMGKFDLEAYNYYRKGNYEGCEYTTTNENNDSVKIVLNKYKDFYVEHIIFLNTPFKKYYEYNIKTLNVRVENTMFYNCAIGLRREFDERGELIKEIDNDALYKFTRQDLVEKMRNEYDIELIDLKEQKAKNNFDTSLSRNAQTLLYYIHLPRGLDPQYGGSRLEVFEIDGTTGKLIRHFGNDARKHFEKPNQSDRKWSPLID